MQTYKELARQYFNGAISRENEKTMLDFVSSSQQNQDSFRTWEEEWKLEQDEEEDLDTDPELLRFRDLRMKSDDAALLRKARQKLIVYRFSSVAAVVALVAALWGVFRPGHTNKAENYFAINAPVGEKCQTVLPDGTVVWLNADTKVRIPESFGTKERKLILSGEAYFEVTKNPDMKFVVETDNCNIVVHGTKFNVSAYPEDAEILTSVIEGAVEVVSGDKNVNLGPGQAVSYNREKSTMEMAEATSTSTNAWVENRLEYKNISLQELSKVIARRYGKAVVFLSDKHQNERFNISLRNNESVTDVISALKLIIPMEVSIEGNTIYIK